MSDHSLRRSFMALHLTLVVVVLFQSGQTLHHAIGALAEHHHLAIFGGLQLLAGVLFVVPRTVKIAGAILVIAFAHAALYSAVNGQFPAEPLVIAAAALFVTLHGPVWGRANGAPRRDFTAA